MTNSISWIEKKRIEEKYYSVVFIYLKKRESKQQQKPIEKHRKIQNRSAIFCRSAQYFTIKILNFAQKTYSVQVWIRMKQLFAAQFMN